MDYRIEQLRYLLREDSSSRIFFQLGELLRREGEAVQAVKVLESGLERHPRYVAAWVSLGRSQRDLHALAEAEHAFETALEIDRENPVAARLLGETAIEREDWLRAVKALKLTRALAGGDAELDAQIALVEERLDGDGQLEQPPKVEARVEPPVRCLDVVNLSADDPFSASTEEADSVGVMSDVFDLAEVESHEVADDDEPAFGLSAAEDSVVEESPEADEEALDEPIVSEPLISDETEEVEIEATEEEPTAVEPETVDTETVDTETVDTETMDTGTVDEETVQPPDPLPAVDESSVGAWSTTMKAAGVSGEEAWTEPTDELTVGEGELSTDGPWIEPTAAVDVVEVVPDEPIEVAEETQEEPPPDETQVAIEPEPEPETDEPSDDEAPPVEKQTFDPIEVTHPDVIEQRAAEVDAETEVEEPPIPEVDEPSGEEAPEILDEPAGDELLPGEDRGFDSSELTRPIGIPPEMIQPEPSFEPAAVAAEVSDEEAGGDETKIADKRHELEHGVPLPTMTLAKLALDQGDRALAMATLESLIERDPTNAEAGSLLGELQAQEAKIENRKLRAVQATSKIVALQGWLDAVRLAAERRVP